MTMPEMQNAPLVVTLFGPMQALVDGQELPRMRSRKGLWLLALLALRHDRPVEREWLAATLWPDLDQTQAFANLRPVLSELRNGLGSQAARLQSPTRPTLRMDFTGAVVDVLRFDTAISNGKQEELEQAIALYRGPLLEGCLEEWVFQERNIREQNCLRSLQKLGDAALSEQNYVAAAGYYQKAVTVEPLREAARRGWMQALAGNGDHNAALQAYRDLIALLRDDPNAVPDAQTRALYERLRMEARQPPRVSANSGREPLAPPKVMGYLPHSLTDLVGREDEREEVMTRLRRSRLVTLTGMGGIGKTRLALEVAREAVGEYTDGVWLVALEALADGERIPAQIASVLGAQEQPGRSLLQSVVEHLRKKRLLLVLDNCEHLLEASARVAQHLLRECEGIRILATSREALGITGETAWAVPCLAVPNPDHLPHGQTTLMRVLAGYEGARLFVERAQAVQKSFQLTGGNARAIADICFRLEGLPLAIELAAARVKSITVEQIAARLNNELALLTGGSRTALSRQQTLRATLDWSYTLLSEPERGLLRGLSVFSGGWTLEAAEAIAKDEGGRMKDEDNAAPIHPSSFILHPLFVLDALTSLVDKSLVVFEAQDAGDGRYRLLEMVRQYAAEKLQASGQAEALRDRHLAWFTVWAETIAPELRGARQSAWLERLEMDYGNLQAALAWSAADASEAEWGLRLTGALWWYWKMRGRISEGRQYLGTALNREGVREETEARATALNGAGALALNQGDYATTRTFHEESLAIYRKQENKRGMASVLNNLGNLARHRNNSAAAWSLHQESMSLYRQISDKQGIAKSLGNLGNILREQGGYAQAKTLGEESLQIYRELEDEQGLSLTLSSLGNLARLQGDYELARTQLEESLAIRQRLKDKQGIAYTLSNLGGLAYAQGDYPAARALHEESLHIRREIGHRASVAWSLNNLGLAALGEGGIVAARPLFEESLTIFRELEDKKGIASSLNRLADVSRRLDEDATARKQLTDSLSLFLELKDREGIAGNIHDLAAIFAMQSEGEKAARLWGAAAALRESIGAALTVVEQENYNREAEQVRSALGAATFAGAWEEGHALDWEQAAEYALQNTQAREGRETS